MLVILRGHKDNVNNYIDSRVREPGGAFIVCNNIGHIE